MHILFVNDNALELYAQKHLCTSQGYALLDSASDEVVFDLDQAALSQAALSHADSNDLQAIRSVHLHPERVNSRYWQYCDESAIAANGAGLRHCADLVWKHLNALKKKYSIGPLIMVVPSHYQAQQLELLMGVANASGVQPIAVVNKAVLALSKVARAAAQGLETRSFAHVDIQLHQTVISYVALTDSNLSISSHDVVAGCSISKLQDALLNHLRSSFIEQDRFDPLHHASTEQQLFDQLDAGAKSIVERGFYKFAADYKQKIYLQNLDESGWLQACTECFETLPKLDGLKVVVDANRAFNSELILGSANLRYKQALLAPRIGSLVAATKTVVEHALKSQASSEDGKQDSIINLETMQIMSGPLFGESQTPNSVSDLTTDSASINSTDVAKNAASKPTNNATHVAINGVAMRIDRASIGFDGGVLHFNDKEPNVEKLLAESTLTAVLTAASATTSDLPTQLPLKPGERLVSDLGDGVVTALRIVE